MTEIAAQVPALFEALSGMNLKELMSNVKSDEAARPNGDNGSAELTNASGSGTALLRRKHRRRTSS